MVHFLVDIFFMDIDFYTKSYEDINNNTHLLIPLQVLSKLKSIFHIFIMLFFYEVTETAARLVMMYNTKTLKKICKNCII